MGIIATFASQERTMRTFVAMMTLVLLGACGQTGPLYLPGEEPPPEAARDTTEPVTATAPEQAGDGV
jgi:predicted small lipoprotein YifL